MTQVELDSLSDEELQRYIDGVDEDRDARPSREQTAGGAPRGLSVLMLLCGAVGMWASLSLVLAEREQLADPGASLSCDINPLVGCSAFLRSQANALFFGVPNALFGLMFFSGVVALALALLTGSRLNPWVWRLLCVGMAGAAAWLVWFQYQAFAVERALCPYCLVTWFVTIPLIVHVLARSVQ
ncbi:vitamin K epoxide reductase family protein, partial [Actinobaculum sp. oral taxon 183 str. F0552]|uniref:vitamin K epoxide reductase family protein n=1 Tax=Actinobaculum sp. oral taxon 183 TaxID=712888 RepID=UPI0003965B2C